MEIEESRSDGVVILTLKGRLDTQSSHTAQERISTLIDRGEHRMILNLGGLEYISSSGLRVFMTAAKRLKEVNGRLVFCSLQDGAAELFEIAGLTELFSICLTGEEALQIVKGN